jgi:predicted Zn-dependent protease
MYRWSILLIAFTSVLASAQERRGVNFYSQEKEAALGASLTADVRKNTTIVESPALSQFMERIGRKLAAILPDSGTTYTFRVVEKTLGGSTNEPLALPGGYVFIPANLFFAARNEAGFASMLAHAIAHVAARHGTRVATGAQVAGLEPLPVMYLNLSSPEGGDERLSNLQRSFEIEADRMTVAMMVGAGYEPELFANYIDRQQNDSEGKWSSLLPRDERVVKIRGAIQQSPQNELLRMQDELHRLLLVPKAQ